MCILLPVFGFLVKNCPTHNAPRNSLVVDKTVLLEMVHMAVVGNG